MIPTRGRCYFARIAEVGEIKPFLVVSGNQRNRALDSFLAVRITTSRKPALASVVELGPLDPLVGRVLCDEIGVVYRHEVTGEAGAVSRDTMRRVEQGLHAALGLVW